MESMASAAIFYGVAALVLGSALYVVVGKNLVHSAFALVAAFFGVAVFYVYLGADFLAGAQVLIYVGGILTLLLFGVMLTNRIYNLNLRSGAIQVVPGALSAGLVFALLVWIIQSVDWGAMDAGDPGPTSESIGRLLVGDYLLPFEIASVLLLIALMGAAMLVRRRGSGSS
ncbi:MAG: NADH-quinone oxidoreductase subunit J [Acidobacteria bacterium]|nr:NADH-quinone oxidoreductase subunit J [Acidobacteriota bacterium]MYF13481.1 NADH-quinone oxidoreductase subunit J [Acidobacteriota bacterium]MYH20848.1 NADH-quinone oxidoreductase subunit J [Acidobacteriota bacterium]MYI95997.1 NADH-quinone oxidoreductase subunit J [Acidobacteriota bacterium]MYK80285.1 NADH-quinone oxidoreductase subunit J [Acidobacteriota bacterium]